MVGIFFCFNFLEKLIKVIPNREVKPALAILQFVGAPVAIGLDNYRESPFFRIVTSNGGDFFLF
jgi:hypothetical protein